MGLDNRDLTDEMMDPANFLRAQGNMMNFKKEQLAKMKKEAEFKNNYTFEPDTKLTKGKVVPKHPKSRVNIQQNGETQMRTSVSSINLDGIAKKKTTAASTDKIQTEDDPFEAEKKPHYAELYKQRKRQVDKTDKSKEDYEFERQGQECTFAPKLMSNPNYLRKKPASR